MSGGTSQVNLSALVAATDHTERATGLDLAGLSALEPHWEALRDLYAPFEAGLRAPTGTVYRHEIPGGQLTNLRQQANSLGLGDRWEQVQELYAVANELLGKPIKVTPTSKVVGDLALFLASGNVDVQRLAEDPQRYDLPASVLGYLAGELGTPPAGFPEPFRSRATEGLPPLAEAKLDAEDDAALDRPGSRAVLSRLLFPGPYEDFERAQATYGDVSVMPTEAFFHGLQPGRVVTIHLETGVEVLIELETLGEAGGDGMRTLHLRVNGQPRPVQVRDRSIAVTRQAGRTADPKDPKQVGSALPGVVLPKVAVGDPVSKGQGLAVVEAMKMESTITCPVDGVIAEVTVAAGSNVEVGDLLFVLA